MSEGTQHYFSESPAGEMRTREIEAVLAGAPRALVTAGGVFSPEGLDRGTEVLLRKLPDPGAFDDLAPAGPILDIGCGWGPIALSAALSHPDREVWAVDVNERSRALSAENARRLGLGNVRVAAPDEVPERLGFAEIRSNPPIRVGKEVLRGILRRWLPRLLPEGTAYLVVAKHLGADSLQRWIAAEFPELSVDRAARDRGFHVIRAVRD
ncbi:methyltransferase [Leucobacter sp. CSA1]|uniref:Methyltransferase n=1 Tax=Leucobacter chromiisoli TaxID=2796471 RepID=A0A934Q6T7_9MICO|nr:methyltransferase [Leucobacter chromiisoli]MBK0419324.1 methyltransferase [Leucobacter chromiisoli]